MEQMPLKRKAMKERKMGSQQEELQYELSEPKKNRGERDLRNDDKQKITLGYTNI